MALIKSTLVIVLCSLLFSCVNIKEIMDSWLNHSKQELILTFGPPAKIVSDGNNGEIYIYAQQYFNQGLYTGNEWVGQYYYWQYTLFYIRPDGKIYHWLRKTERIPPAQYDINMKIRHGY